MKNLGALFWFGFVMGVNVIILVISVINALQKYFGA